MATGGHYITMLADYTTWSICSPVSMVVLGNTTFLISIWIPSTFVLVLADTDANINTNTLPLLKSIISTWYNYFTNFCRGRQDLFLEKQVFKCDRYWKRKRVWCSERHFLAGPYDIKNVITFKSSTSVSDTSVHMDYYIAPLKKAWDGRKVYWDSWKQAVRQFFTTSKSVQNMITYVMQI